MKKQNRNLESLQCVGRTRPRFTPEHEKPGDIGSEEAGSPAVEALLFPKPRKCQKSGPQVHPKSWRKLKRNIFFPPF